MKRLIKADYYLDNKDTDEKIKNSMIDCAKYYCDINYMNQSSIEYHTNGNEKYVSFGDIEIDGFIISVSMYNENEINRIGMSFGKNSKGQLMHTEIREQSMLDNFLNKRYEFEEWIQQSIENIDQKYLVQNNF